MKKVIKAHQTFSRERLGVPAGDGGLGKREGRLAATPPGRAQRMWSTLGVLMFGVCETDGAAEHSGTVPPVSTGHEAPPVSTGRCGRTPLGDGTTHNSFLSLSLLGGWEQAKASFRGESLNCP